MQFRGISLMLVLVLALSLMVTGCEKAAEKATEQAMEKAIEDSSGGTAKVDLNGDKIEVKTDEGTLEVGGSNEWPSKMPADVPKFTYGTISSVLESTTPQEDSILVGFENVSADAFDKYKSDLEGAGWKIEMTSKAEDGFLINAIKPERQVVVSISNKSGGVTYAQFKEE